MMRFHEFKFERATPANALFAALRQQWDAQMAGQEDAPEHLYAMKLGYAETIVSEDQQDPKYGIYVLYHPDGPIFEGFAHVNHKLPGTSAAEVRLVWNAIAPRYHFESIRPEEYASLTVGFVFGGMDLCKREMSAEAMKMLLDSPTDREHAVSIATTLQFSAPDLDVAVRGNWLHINGIRPA